MNKQSINQSSYNSSNKMTFMCCNCFKTYLRLDYLVTHDEYSCIAKNFIYDEKSINQNAKIPEAIKTIRQDSSQQADKASWSYSTEAYHEIEQYVKKQKVVKEGFGRRASFPSVTVSSKDDANDNKGKEKKGEEDDADDDNDDQDKNDISESDFSSEIK